MTQWSSSDLSRIGDAEELEIASVRPDGTVRPYVIIWAVRYGDGLFVRSAHGPGNPWYRRAAAAGAGRIRVGGIETDVTFVPADPDAHDGIDAAYRTKYAAFPKQYVDPVVGTEAAAATLKILPAGA